MARIQEDQGKKGLKDPDDHHGVATLLELNVLECEVTWDTQKTNAKKGLKDPDNHDGVITPRPGHPGVEDEVGLRTHHYQQS